MLTQINVNNLTRPQWVKQYVIISLAVSLSAHGQITANLEIDPAEVYVGDSVTLTCRITVGPGSNMVNMVNWKKRITNAEDAEEETVIAINNIVQKPYLATNRFEATITTEGEIDSNSVERKVILTLTVSGKYKSLCIISLMTVCIIYIR